MESVMARASPRKRALSKNTVSPKLPDSTMETARRPKVTSPMAPTLSAPPVTRTQVRSRAPAPSVRSALRLAELSVPDRRRTKRLITAQVNAEASE
jgi:hypothetical protein